MSGDATVVLSLVGLVMTLLAPGIVVMRTGLRRSRDLVLAGIMSAVVSMVLAIYYVAISDPTHNHYALLFAAVAVAALAAAFLSRPPATVAAQSQD